MDGRESKRTSPGRHPEKDIMLGFRGGVKWVRFVESDLVIDLHIERWAYIYTIFQKPA